MKFNALIFDMDGTIVDTTHIWKQATRDLVEARGIIYSEKLEAEIQKYVHGLATHESCKIVKEIAQLPDNVDDLIKEKSRRAVALYEQGIRFIDGFEKFHANSTNYPLSYALATNADDATLAVTNKNLNLERFFGKHLYNVSQVNFQCKPHPALYLHAARQLALDPAACLAFEDSTHGVRAAKAAGMFCIGINSGKNRNAIAAADIRIG